MNNIDSLKDHNNNWMHTREEISQYLTSHFKDISTSTDINMDDSLFMLIPSIITEADNSMLTRILSHQEIHDTVKSTENWSAPGPKGFQEGFYKIQWSIIGEDICQMIKRFFETKHIPKQINKTYISLIPKKKKSLYAADDRPIGLCNTSYKIISKIIVNRLKPLMEKIISPYQVAYVSGRLISDNTVITQEIIHFMNKKRGHIGWMASKLDMSKDFDILECKFLLKVLKYFGFNEDFCDLINQCISTTSLAVMLNGSPCEEFYPKRDDCLIFTQATTNSVNNLLNLLHNFSTQSGQVINFEKSSVHFSKRTNPEVAANLIQMLGVKTMNTKERYMMGTFKIPNNIIKKLTTIQRKFFWGYSSNRGKNPVAWLKVCKPKEFGGLAFRDPEMLNLALLTKLAWILCTESDALWSQIMGSKYFRNGDILHQQIKAVNGSYTWNGITKGLLIQSLYLDTSKEDNMIWMPAKDGKFSVKSAYKKLTMENTEITVGGRVIQRKVCKALWKSKLAHKIIFFAWNCLHEAHFTRLKLALYNESIDTQCATCGSEAEIMEHIIFSCAQARKVWNLVDVDIDEALNTHHSVSEWVENCLMSHTHNAIIPRISQWKPPLQHFMKFNVDASFDYNTNTIGTGVVLRSHSSNCEGIKGTYADGPLNPEMGECMAIREDLTWAKEEHFTKIHIKADAKLVI
ncbi:uncharacterized protein LOC113337068 [Papaver somniferum]|uniref:uncharacterized protein LOC113337068 n=1 Tax=Papaver somniferum TaxID=3469 RepID=UPI000E702AF9|nr:uncharacterized protein LOC113337068 [Papaver somniferum]